MAAGPLPLPDAKKRRQRPPHEAIRAGRRTWASKANQINKYSEPTRHHPATAQESTGKPTADRHKEPLSIDHTRHLRPGCHSGAENATQQASSITTDNSPTVGCHCCSPSGSSTEAKEEYRTGGAKSTARPAAPGIRRPCPRRIRQAYHSTASDFRPRQACRRSKDSSLRRRHRPRPRHQRRHPGGPQAGGDAVRPQSGSPGVKRFRVS